MERSIRIGKDFNVRWSINKVVDGERQPYELAGKELVLRYRTPYGLKEATEWKTEGNTIVWTFRGREQKALGSYELILTENGGKDGMVTVDTCRAFKLVAHSCEETEGSGSDIVIEDVVLESEVTFAALRGPQGERGPEGPQGPQGERGPQGEQGPAGPSYDDTEIKGKLAELSEANEVLKEAQQFTDVAIKDLQDMKIDRENDDYYPKMAVGLADNLAGVDVVDSEINFRRSGGGAISDGVARIEAIKGNSVVWNMIGKRKNNPASASGITIVDNGDSYTISGTASATVHLYITDNFFNDNTHIYCLLGCPQGGSSSTYYLEEGYTSRGDYGEGYIGSFSKTSGNTHKLSIYVKEGYSITSPLTFKPKVFDLTQMFGAGNEPTTIEEFYARIPMGVDLNAYNEGEVIHMNVQSIESVGVNQWDEEWELGRIDVSTGNDQAVYDSWRSKNFTEVIPNAEYYIKGGALVRIVYYDKDFKFVDWWGCDPYKLATIPSNVRYVRLTQQNSTAYAGGISINLSDAAVNGKYYPYIKRVEDLSVIRKYFPQGMKSAGSAHDEIRYNKASGKWEKVVRIGEIDFSGARAYNIDNIFLLPIADMKAPTTNPERGTGLLCVKYPMHNGTEGYNVANMQDKSMLRMNNGNIYIKDSAFGSDATAFKAAMAGVMLYYELAEPIVTEIDEADQFKDLDYQVWNAGTEKAIAEGKSAPLAAGITYGFNAIGKIKELESLVAALRAKVGI